MKLKNRKPLGLEALEDRWVPATIRFDGSNLYVSNPHITAGASKVQVIQQGNNSFEVLDGAAPNGFFAVSGNINIQGNNAKDTVLVNVTAAGLSGNLFVTTGNGASTVTVDSSVAGGLIGGNTTISMGNGANSVAFGNALGVTERGNLSVSARGTGANSATVGGGANATGVFGNTLISGFPTVTLGAATDKFGGNVNVSNTANSLPSTVTLGGTVQGNFAVQGGTGSNTTLNVNGSVLGLASFNLGNGTNAVTLGGGAAAVSLGSLFLNGGNGANLFTANGGNAATVLGNATVNWGNGANAFGASTGLAVNGNLFIHDGNGGLDVATNTFQGTVNGEMSVNAGSGNNLFTLDVTAGANVGGTFSYLGGNGGNSVTINNTTANVTLFNVRFGNSSSNLMTLNAGSPGTGNLTGLIAWGVPTTASGSNGLVDNGYVWQNAITLINVPS